MPSSNRSSRHSLDDPNLGGRLHLEWARLRTRPDALRRATSWGLLDRPIDDLDAILATVGFETPGTAATDRALRRLVAIAANDELAGRVIVQRLLPGLLSAVRKRRHLGLGADAFDELIGAAWIAIATFNQDRNPSSIAAALIADADFHAFRAKHRRRSADERPTDLIDERPTNEATHASDELRELFELALDSGVPKRDIELLRQLLAARHTIDVAAALELTPRTIRNRRDRITDRLREVALAA